MLCAIRHPETFKLQSLLVDTDRMCGSLRLRLRRVARGRLSRKSWTDDERNTQNGPGFEADEQVSPGASFAGQELAQGLCAQNLSPDCLQLAGEVQSNEQYLDRAASYSTAILLPSFFRESGIM